MMSVLYQVPLEIFDQSRCHRNCSPEIQEVDGSIVHINLDVVGMEIAMNVPVEKKTTQRVFEFRDDPT